MKNLNAEQVKEDIDNCIEGECELCAYYDQTACKEHLMHAALALITSQEQRIKELTEENERLKAPQYYIYSDGRIEALGHNDPVGKPGECGLSRKCKADTVRKMESLLIDEVFKVARCQLTCDEPNVTDQEVRAIIKRVAKEMLEGGNGY